MIARVRERKELHKQRGKLYRTGVVMVGVLVILGGLALSLPGVPGPGLLLVAVGLGMLALEFDRAERLLERILQRLDRVADQAAAASPLQKALMAVLALIAVAAAVAAVLLWEIPYVPG
jgi:uncharacterized protein (TIGR02611 family)